MVDLYVIGESGVDLNHTHDNKKHKPVDLFNQQSKEFERDCVFCDVTLTLGMHNALPETWPFFCENELND